MIKLLGISGSLRKASFNKALLHAALELPLADVRFTAGTIEGIPLYNADIEREGVPAPVQLLRDQIAGADGVILFTPEYNNSMPGVFKNAIDWASSSMTGAPNVFAGRAFALAGTSPSPFGTLLSQNAWLPVFRTLGADLWSGKRLMLPKAGALFDKDSKLVDEDARGRLKAFVEAFADYVKKEKGL
ncbi:MULTISPECIES: NADPH-dependent FMN reductase [unclassified Rhizobium]|uniref:NADPH-dependent FMN reductase n=1 Tax=unclassified Rhizobium TaxID=2613769 RepID=UPI0006F8C5EA|nr:MULTISPECIES: NADPH-dependent FMN reductase [unclassified Rhizobium]KQV38115.1 NADPH-dependent FMN reductase [Rhizobium sp. Root1212]KRD30772.1 NADPH-dependent FMN reductase [Rhizobium sp. Root268]